MRRNWWKSIATTVALFAGFVAGAAYAGAQDTATPTDGGPAPHPAHIHAGSCDELGDVVHPLNDVTGAHLEGTPGATPASAESGLPGEVLGQSTTTVDAPLDDLLAEPHAINIHESADAMDTYIACGEVSGEPDEDGTLIIDLDQVNASGVNGQAILSDSGNGTTQVVITLADASAETVGTPAATPQS